MDVEGGGPTLPELAGPEIRDLQGLVRVPLYYQCGTHHIFEDNDSFKRPRAAATRLARGPRVK